MFLLISSEHVICIPAILKLGRNKNNQSLSLKYYKYNKCEEKPSESIKLEPFKTKTENSHFKRNEYLLQLRLIFSIIFFLSALPFIHNSDKQHEIYKIYSDGKKLQKNCSELKNCTFHKYLLPKVNFLFQTTYIQ